LPSYTCAKFWKSYMPPAAWITGLIYIYRITDVLYFLTYETALNIFLYLFLYLYFLNYILRHIYGKSYAIFEVQSFWRSVCQRWVFFDIQSFSEGSVFFYVQSLTLSHTMFSLSMTLSLSTFNTRINLIKLENFLNLVKLHQLQLDFYK
jgi:signal transduction histidine kinase